jgi:hypothetical protein
MSTGVNRCLRRRLLQRFDPHAGDHQPYTNAGTVVLYMGVSARPACRPHGRVLGRREVRRPGATGLP